MKKLRELEFAIAVAMNLFHLYFGFNSLSTWIINDIAILPYKFELKVFLKDVDFGEYDVPLGSSIRTKR